MITRGRYQMGREAERRGQVRLEAPAQRTIRGTRNMEHEVTTRRPGGRGGRDIGRLTLRLLIVLSGFPLYASGASALSNPHNLNNS